MSSLTCLFFCSFAQSHTRTIISNSCSAHGGVPTPSTETSIPRNADGRGPACVRPTRPNTSDSSYSSFAPQLSSILSRKPFALPQTATNDTCNLSQSQLSPVDPCNAAVSLITPRRKKTGAVPAWDSPPFTTRVRACVCIYSTNKNGSRWAFSCAVPQTRRFLAAVTWPRRQRCRKHIQDTYYYDSHRKHHLSFEA